VSEIKETLYAHAENVRLEDGTLIATVWAKYPSRELRPRESWLEMMDRTADARAEATRISKVRALRFAASNDMLAALQEVLKAPGLQSGLQALCAAAVAKATGRSIEDVITGA
jgi:hypothetical protein